jgi:antitoxin MazE
MVTKVQSWGNSQGLRLSKQVLEDARVAVGDDVDVAVRDGAIVITPVKHLRGKANLRKLVAKIPKGYKAKEIDWGDPVGREVW